MRSQILLTVLCFPILFSLNSNCADAQMPIQAEVMGPKQPLPHKRFPYMNRTLFTYDEWQSDKLTIKIFSALPNDRELEIQLSDFSIVGLTRQEVHKHLGEPIDTHLNEKKEVLGKNESWEDFSLRSNRIGFCGASGYRWLRLKFEDGVVSAYRRCYFRLM